MKASEQPIRAHIGECGEKNVDGYGPVILLVHCNLSSFVNDQGHF